MGFRRKARECALQLLFQHEFGAEPPEQLLAGYFTPERRIPEAARNYAEELLRGSLEHKPELDELIRDHTQHWRLERMALVDRNILRLAVYEFCYQRQTPQRVVINEACELARKYSGEEAVAFVNGVLDGIMKELARRSA